MSARNSILRLAALGTLTVLWSGSALAQNWDQLGRGLELKAHQALMKQV